MNITQTVTLNLLLLFLDSVLDTVYSTEVTIMDSETTGCCNGTLSYVWHHSIFPCSNMTCCNTSETVAVVHVNHALGFCFRCVVCWYTRPHDLKTERQQGYKNYTMPKTEFSSKECFTEGKEVVTSNNETLDYRPRTCCEGAKFKVHLNSEDTALKIQCIKR